jgi:hypothetical protein
MLTLVGTKWNKFEIQEPVISRIIVLVMNIHALWDRAVDLLPQKAALPDCVIRSAHAIRDSVANLPPPAAIGIDHTTNLPQTIAGLEMASFNITPIS